MKRYRPDMDIGDRIAVRLDRAMKQRGITGKDLAKAAGISSGSLSGILNRTIQKKTGKPPVMALGNLEKACKKLGIPVWVILHADPALFDLFLNADPRMQGLITAEPAQAMTAAMALVSEVRGSAGQSGAEPEVAPPPRLAKAISKPRAPKKPKPSRPRKAS